MSKSLVTFIRKSLKIKGRSEHTGRGCYWMHRNEEVSYDEIVERLKSLLPKWKKEGLVEEVKEFTDKNDVRHCVIMFSKDFGSYRHFYTNDRMTGSGVLRLLGGVAMVIRL